jgi:hypothetical protein
MSATPNRTDPLSMESVWQRKKPEGRFPINVLPAERGPLRYLDILSGRSGTKSLTAGRMSGMLRAASRVCSMVVSSEARASRRRYRPP